MRENALSGNGPAMRILAIETATDACSVALFDGDRCIGSFHETIGRGHAERLVPMIAQLPDKGRAEQIRVSLGPGSFTGVRIGIATANALGVAWQADVLGYPTLALLARMGIEDERGPVTVCMNAGHGEWFVQNFAADGTAQAPLRSIAPDAAIHNVHSRIVGNRARELAEATGGTASPPDLPDARAVPLLATDQLIADVRPHYGRAPDAKLPSR